MNLVVRRVLTHLLRVVQVVLILNLLGASTLAGGRHHENGRRNRVKQFRSNSRGRTSRIQRRRAVEPSLREQVQALITHDAAVGEDPAVRRAALSALGQHAGTVVVMDPRTGRIYSIVNQQWALHEGFKPCSTIKLVTGLAGLSEHIIDPNNTARTAYAMDLTRALAYSDNPYFQQVGGQLGFARMIGYARALGFGEITGINSENE